MMDEEPDDEEVSIELRSAPEVAARLLVLAALCRRAFIEASPEAGADTAAAERFDLANWLDTEGLLAEATPAERRLLTARHGAWSADEVAAATWRGEASLALAWALRLVGAMPGYDAPAELGPLLARIPEPWDSTAAFRRDARLRDEATIAQERERAELWQWRGEVAALLATLPPQERPEVEAAIRDVAVESLAAGLIDRVIDDDFAVRDSAYRDLSADRAEELEVLAFQRLAALDWVCGLAERWDDASLPS